MNKVTYKGNDEETYTLLLDEKEVAELMVGEDSAIEIVASINSFITKQKYKNYPDMTVEIQNDGDKLGVIVDIYEQNGNEWVDGITIWFDDYID